MAGTVPRGVYGEEKAMSIDPAAVTDRFKSTLQMVLDGR